MSIIGNVSDLVMSLFKWINNLYNATGQKVSKIVTQTGVTTKPKNHSHECYLQLVKWKENPTGAGARTCGT